MHGGLLAGLTEGAAAAVGLSIHELSLLILNSVATGLCLVIATYFFNRMIEKSAPEVVDANGAKNGGKRNPVVKRILGAANQLFLTVGLTGILILVNNNIVRAFAIYAAIALVRFRVTLDAKNINAAFFFSVIAGIACGLHELYVAWIMTGVYFVLVAMLMAVIKISIARQKISAEGLHRVAGLVAGVQAPVGLATQLAGSSASKETSAS